MAVKIKYLSLLKECLREGSCRQVTMVEFSRYYQNETDCHLTSTDMMRLNAELKYQTSVKRKYNWLNQRVQTIYYLDNKGEK